MKELPPSSSSASPKGQTNIQFNNRDNYGIQTGVYNNYSLATSTTKSSKSLALSTYIRHKQLRCHDTCGWILESEEYKEWIDSEHKVSNLGIKGQMGCGKSTLITRIIEDTRTKDDVKLLWFFTDKKTGQTSLKQLLMTFWDQLHDDSLVLDDESHDRNDLSNNRSDKLKNSTDIELIHKLLGKLQESLQRRVCIVVDAFDELPVPEQRKLLHSFVEPCRQILRVSMLVSYRTGNKPHEAMWTVDHEIDVGKTENGPDMRKYLVGHLTKTLPQSKTCERKEDVDTVADKIQNLADGMFLWAAVSVKVIGEAQNRDEADISLEELVTPGNYDKIVAKWEGNEEGQDWRRRLAMQATALLTNPAGQLSVAALAEAATLDTDGKKLDRAWLMENPMKLVQYCNPFVEYDAQLEVFRFCHASMHAYFLNHAISTTRFADLTLAYICRSEFSCGPYMDSSWYRPRELQNCLIQHPYLQFASSHWVAGVKAVQERLEKSTKQHLVKLYHAHKNLLLAFQVFCFSSRMSMPAHMLPAHIFSYFSLLDCLNRSSNSPEPSTEDSTAVDGNGRTALHWAMCGDDSENILSTATYLLNATTRFNNSDTARKVRSTAAVAPDNEGLTPLHYAAQRGHLESVEKLLVDDTKKALDARSQRKGTPLQLAAREGHIEVVKKLLESGADVNVNSINLGTALHAAVASGSTDCVEAIVTHKKLRRNAYGDKFGTPLHTAAYYGHKEIVDILLRERFNARKKSWRYGSTVTAAAAGCYEGKDSDTFRNILEALCNHGAKVDAPGETNETALHYAARFGHEKILEFLLKHKANVKAESPMGTPFEIAEEKGYTAVLEILKMYQGDVKSKPRREGVLGGGRHARKMVMAIWIPVWRVALANNDTKHIYDLIETYEQVCERAIKNDRQTVTQRLAPLGTAVFSLVVNLVTRRQQQQWRWKRKLPKTARKESRKMDEHASAAAATMRGWKKRTIDRIETVLCYFGFKEMKSERHAHEISLGATVTPDSQLKSLDEVLDRLTVAAVRVLGAALAKGKDIAITSFANAWIDALQTVVVCEGSSGPDMLKVLVKNRADELKTLLKDDATLAACNLANVGIELLATALQRGSAYMDLSNGLTQMWTSALSDAGDSDHGGVSMEHVFQVLQTFITMFKAALDRPDRDRVELLANVGVKIVIEAVKTENKGLINIVKDMMIKAREEAESAKMGNVVESVLKERKRDIDPATSAKDDESGKDMALAILEALT